MDEAHTRLTVKLNDVLRRVESRGIAKAAENLRAIAVDPESKFGSASDWKEAVIETLASMGKDANTPNDLRSELIELRREAHELLFGPGQKQR